MFITNFILIQQTQNSTQTIILFQPRKTQIYSYVYFACMTRKKKGEVVVAVTTKGTMDFLHKNFQLIYSIVVILKHGI